MQSIASGGHGFSNLMQGFSTPIAPFSEEFFAAVAGEYVRGVTNLLVSDGAADTGALCALRTWINEPRIARRAPSLDLSLGDARAVLSGRLQMSPGDAAAAIGLALASEGVLTSRWRHEFDEPQAIRLGRLVLPPCTSVEVDSREAPTVHVEVRPVGRTETHGITLCAGVSPSYHGGSDTLGQLLPTVRGANEPITVLPGYVVPVLAAEGVSANVLDDIPGEARDALQASLDLLETLAPEYASWVCRMLRFVYLLKPFNGFVESGSVDSYLGLAHLSAYANPVAVGEILIHEAAHQYFNLLTLVGDFDDGTDTNEYYSPAVHRQRPLDRIAIAYHAFANVTIYYQRVLENGADVDRWCEHHIEKWDKDLRTLEAPILNNPALTPVGKALCEPLIETLGLSGSAAKP